MKPSSCNTISLSLASATRRRSSSGISRRTFLRLKQTTGVVMAAVGIDSTCSQTTQECKNFEQPNVVGLNMSSKFETAVPCHLSAAPKTKLKGDCSYGKLSLSARWHLLREARARFCHTGSTRMGSVTLGPSCSADISSAGELSSYPSDLPSDKHL